MNNNNKGRFSRVCLVELFFLSLSFVFSLRVALAVDAPLPISAFADRSTEPWKNHSFGRVTDYRLVSLDGEWALQATSDGAASAFYRSVKVDLTKTPYLSWRWRIEQRLGGLDEMSRNGDDYAARVYVVHKRGFFDKGIAVNYVWSGSNVRGSRWPNAYAMDSSYMLALQDSQTPLRQWQLERRNVREDFKTLMGMDIRSVHVVVLMTDTDNSGQSAQAHYGDLVFSSE